MVICLLMVQKFINSKQKILKLKHFKRLVNIRYKKNGLNGFVYDFSVNHDAIPDIADI